ncbi:hypothetical protein SH203_02958 [Brevundimonas sp. SH203]|nr:hypothetical protein SH203_02958 [Brevundimonas sp. SH203]
MRPAPRPEPDARRRAEGLMLGASAGASAAWSLRQHRSSECLNPQAVLVHAAQSCLKHRRFVANDLISRLRSDDTGLHGQDRGSLRSMEVSMPKASQTFIVAVAPVCLRTMGRSRSAQRDLHSLGLAFQQTPADVEALEVTGRFIGRALLGYGRRIVFEPITWIGGDDCVAWAAGGGSLPKECRGSLASAIAQARAVSLRESRWPVAARALKAARAEPSAFVLAGMLLGAMYGPRSFSPLPPNARALAALAEGLLQSSPIDMASLSGRSRSR